MNLEGLTSWLSRNLTILRWVGEYSPAHLRGDLAAGLSVGVILIPQSMAYAVLAGVPPVYGLYASVIPLMVYPLFGTSRHLAVGVVAIDMLVVAAGVSALAPASPQSYIALAVLLSFMAGLIQVAMSAARLGFIVNLLSKPVVLGFTAAAPLIIAVSQLGNLLGMEIDAAAHIFVMAGDLLRSPGEAHMLTAVIGLGSIVLIVLLNRLLRVSWEPLIIVAGGALAVWGLDLHGEGVAVVGAVEGGLPRAGLPSAGLEEMRRLLPTAITLALVQFMNVTSLGRTFASRHRYSLRPNSELFAIGAANLAAGIFRGLPVSASFSRSAINEQSGARTPLSNVFSALLVVLALLLLTPLLYYIPMAALAAVIITAALGLIDVGELRQLFYTKERDGYIALFTFATTLLVGIQEGILLGVSASLVAVLVRASRPNVAVLGHIEGSRFFRDVQRHPEAVQVEGILVLRVDASFSFNNAEFFKEHILSESERRGRPVQAVVIDGISINDMDSTAVEALELVVDELGDHGIELHFAGLKGAIRDVLLRSGLARRLGGTHFHITPDRAVRYILQKVRRKDPADGRLEWYLGRVD
ncbi:MAG: sulfate permease [Balneolaceae bacterium]|nr:sulfate permease [Balneolaceae bacterium]